MPTVKLHLPPANSIAALHLCEVARETSLPDYSEIAAALEATGALLDASIAVRMGATLVTVTASEPALTLVARACRRRISETYRDCPAIPVLLAIALGCEAAVEAKAA